MFITSHDQFLDQISTRNHGLVEYGLNKLIIIIISPFTEENRFINFADGIFNFTDGNIDGVKSLTCTVLNS